MSNSGARFAAALILVLVFGSGFLVGMAWDTGTEAPAAEPSIAQDAEQAPGGDARAGEAEEAEDERPQRRRRAYDRVEPTEEQRTAMDSIVDYHRDRMRTLNDEFREAYYPRYYGIIDDTRELIKAEMTPVQAAKYDSILAEWDRENRNQDGRLPFRRD
jgi:hypothetical protein